MPTVVEQSERGERFFDLYSRFLRDQIIFLANQIDDEVANNVASQLLYLEAEDPDRDVQLHINSPGGAMQGWALTTP